MKSTVKLLSLCIALLMILSALAGCYTNTPVNNDVNGSTDNTDNVDVDTDEFGGAPY